MIYDKTFQLENFYAFNMGFGIMFSLANLSFCQ